MFTDPTNNIAQFGLHENDYVADLGAGSGAYSLAAARVVKSGKVFAVDIQKDILSRLKKEAQKEGLYNIEVIWGDLEVASGSKVRQHACDAVIMSNVLFQTEDKDALIKEAKRILKPGGRVLLIDWSASFGGIGPRDGDVVSPETAKQLFEANDFRFVVEIGVGAQHYGLIFRK